MKVTPLSLPEVLLIDLPCFSDPRGLFMETFHAGKLAGSGIPDRFVQDNHSHSVRGVLRGLHGQRVRPQGKLVRVVAGEVFDVAVDARKSSPRFGQWVGVSLRGDRPQQLYVPPGFLHGFCVLSETADVVYKCTDFYDPSDEVGVRWDDPALGIRWPVSAPLLSAKDAALPSLSEFKSCLP